MRKTFAEFMESIAEKDKDVILIVSDIGYATFDNFREKYPNQFFNLGICEQSIVSAAAGMALQGLKPYVFTITPFLTERAFEQVKCDINLNKANVKLVGFAEYPNLGPTHALVDGGSYMKLFKNISSYYPKDTSELEQNLLESYDNKNPAFIKLI